MKAHAVIYRNAFGRSDGLPMVLDLYAGPGAKEWAQQEVESLRLLNDGTFGVLEVPIDPDGCEHASSDTVYCRFVNRDQLWWFAGASFETLQARPSRGVTHTEKVALTILGD